MRTASREEAEEESGDIASTEKYMPQGLFRDVDLDCPVCMPLAVWLVVSGLSCPQIEQRNLRGWAAARGRAVAAAVGEQPRGARLW